MAILNFNSSAFSDCIHHWHTFHITQQIFTIVETHIFRKITSTLFKEKKIIRAVYKAKKKGGKSLWKCTK